MMKKRHYLIVDGYNMIGAWSMLSHLQQDEIQLARDLLLEELSNYAKYRDIQVMVVFDAHLVPGITTVFDKFELQVVFTADGETADAYIEREVARFVGPLSRVTVATSDMAEQWMVLKQGALRQSAQELELEIRHAKREIAQDIQHHYQRNLRRHSPWRLEQLNQLEWMRDRL